MQYLAVIHADEAQWDALSEADRAGTMEEYGAIAAEPVVVDGYELQPVATATTVRVRDGETVVTDGPFAELKEALGGYFVFDVETMDGAVEFAAKIPGAEHGAVEVRPIYVDEGAES